MQSMQIMQIGLDAAAARHARTQPSSCMSCILLHGGAGLPLLLPLPLSVATGQSIELSHQVEALASLTFS